MNRDDPRAPHASGALDRLPKVLLQRRHPRLQREDLRVDRRQLAPQRLPQVRRRRCWLASPVLERLHQRRRRANHLLEHSAEVVQVLRVVADRACRDCIVELLDPLVEDDLRVAQLTDDGVGKAPAEEAGAGGVPPLLQPLLQAAALLGQQLLEPESMVGSPDWVRSLMGLPDSLLSCRLPLRAERTAETRRSSPNWDRST